MRRGFTLIELLVVMAIVALLVAIATPRYFAHLDRSKESVLRADLSVMRDALDKFYGDHGRYPDSLEELVAYAKECCVVRELTPDERELFGLPPR